MSEDKQLTDKEKLALDNVLIAQELIKDAHSYLMAALNLTDDKHTQAVIRRVDEAAWETTHHYSTKSTFDDIIYCLTQELEPDFKCEV